MTKPEKFYRNRYFVAANPRDFSMTARCTTCNQPFDDHYNGCCPVLEGDEPASAKSRPSSSDAMET